MTINYSDISKTLENNIFLIREKLKKINEDIKTAKNDVDKDIERIVKQKIGGTTNNIFREKEKVLMKIDKDALVKLKIKYLNDAKVELKKLEEQLVTKQKLVAQQNCNTSNDLQ